MTSPSAGRDERAADLRATRQLLEDLRRSVDETLGDAVARLDVALGDVEPVGTGPRRPASVAPRRMEQMVRSPEPTADLDDLVDVLAPRLLERLLPALRDALRDAR